jgi:murein DD-endopeptidase MepM/ murein hydrolase activator NlpD
MNRQADFIGKVSVLLVLITVLLLVGSVSGQTVKAAEEISLDKDNPSQGSLLKITAPSSLQDGKVVFADKSYLFRETKEQAVALVPVSYWVTPGEYTLSVLDSGDTSQQQWSITVREGDFAESYLTVDKENEEKVNPTDPERQKRQKREQQLVHQAREESSSERLWDEPFQWPLDGRITTDFGATRYHNGELANRHSGIDIAAAVGTPVQAANSGVVVLADNLLRTGKTVIIDHGWNVFSAYLHHSELKVEVGDKVDQGEVIGLIGETGFATGPHLHWSISVGRTFLNPREFADLKL